MIDIEDIARRLEHGGQAIRHLVEGITETVAQRRSAPGTWSILEVVNHLYDEEREDFRARIDLVLHHPGELGPPIDPEGWVTARDYQSRKLDESLANFLEERRHSVEWVRSLADADWDAAIVHPAIGSLSAGTLAVSWVAHDYLHIRQITRLLYEEWNESMAPYSPDYAGQWK